MLSLLFAKKKVVLIKERTESVWAKFTSEWFFIGEKYYFADSYSNRTFLPRCIPKEKPPLELVRRGALENTKFISLQI